MSDEYTAVDDQWLKSLLESLRSGDPIARGNKDDLIRNLLLTLEHERELRGMWQEKASDLRAPVTTEKLRELAGSQDAGQVTELVGSQEDDLRQLAGPQRHNLLTVGKFRLAWMYANRDKMSDAARDLVWALKSARSYHEGLENTAQERWKEILRLRGEQGSELSDQGDALRDRVDELEGSSREGLQLVLHVQAGGTVNIEQRETGVLEERRGQGPDSKHAQGEQVDTEPGG